MSCGEEASSTCPVGCGPHACVGPKGHPGPHACKHSTWDDDGEEFEPEWNHPRLDDSTNHHRFVAFLQALPDGIPDSFKPIDEQAAAGLDISSATFKGWREKEGFGVAGLAELREAQLDHEEIHRLFHEEGLSIMRIRAERGLPKQLVPSLTIRDILGFDSWDAYKDAREEKRRRERRESEKKRDDILDRDGHECVVTGKSGSLHVHHIDGDRSNADSENLVTLHESVHEAIHGHLKPHKYDSHREVWPLAWAYCRWLRENGHPEAGFDYHNDSFAVVLQGGLLPERKRWSRRLYDQARRGDGF